jgi:hypothetical protein
MPCTGLEGGRTVYFRSAGSWGPAEISPVIFHYCHASTASDGTMYTIRPPRSHPLFSIKKCHFYDVKYHQTGDHNGEGGRRG